MGEVQTARSAQSSTSWGQWDETRRGRKRGCAALRLAGDRSRQGSIMTAPQAAAGTSSKPTWAQIWRNSSPRERAGTVVAVLVGLPVLILLLARAPSPAAPKVDPMFSYGSPACSSAINTGATDIPSSCYNP